MKRPSKLQNLILLLGDQLDERSAAFDGFDPRMSNYCTGCPFDPAGRTGPQAYPFTTLYWDFLMQHEPALAKNPRIVMQVRNLKRLTAEEKEAIHEHAAQVRESYAVKSGGPRANVRARDADARAG